MPDQIEFKVSEGLIKPIIEAKINAAIIEAMGGHEKMVGEMLNAYMTQRVDSEGKEDRYSDSRNKPRLQWLMHKMVEAALKDALTGFLQTKQDFMKKEFEKFFNSKKGTSQLVAAMQDGFCDALKDKWRTNITLSIPGDR